MYKWNTTDVIYWWLVELNRNIEYLIDNNNWSSIEARLASQLLAKYKVGKG